METETRKYRHSTPVQIRFNDIDILGHVNNAVYQHYYDYARVHYFRNVLGAVVDWKKYSLILASIKIDYYTPISLNDEIEVETRVEILGNKSISMKQKLINTKTREVISTNRAVLVAFNSELSHTIEIPSDWKIKLVHFEENISMKYPVSTN
jgi:acyl-CoA thioester hydrolase